MFDLLKEHLKDAMRAKDVIKRDILRFIVSQIKNKQIDSKEDLDEESIVKIIKKEIKQIHETIDALKKNGSSEDEISDEEKKIAILGVYLPEMLSEEQTRKIVQDTIESTGIDVSQKRGQLIGMIMKEYGSSIDGALLNTIISNL